MKNKCKIFRFRQFSTFRVTFGYFCELKYLNTILDWIDAGLGLANLKSNLQKGICVVLNIISFLSTTRKIAQNSLE